jgi:hypothetical protein
MQHKTIQFLFIADTVCGTDTGGLCIRIISIATYFVDTLKNKIRVKWKKKEGIASWKKNKK